MGLKIGLDLVNLSGFIGGMGRLARQLLEGLSSYDRENEYFLFMNEKAVREINLDPEQFHKISSGIPRNRYIPSNQLYFTLRSCLLPALDILHSPVSVAPLFLIRPNKTMVTVTDLAHLQNPESSAWLTRLWRNVAYPICFHKISHIVAISESTKKDIMEHYRVPEIKVSVIYLYVSIQPASYSPERSQKLKKQYNIPDKYILHVGYSHKRKNQLGLIQAYRHLKNKTSLPHKLFLVGPGGWDRSFLEDYVQETGLENEVLFPGFIPDEHMAFIYSNADVFVFPSLYEGFGYPPLEAMACGTPVIVSDRPSLPEVVGDAALLVDPLDAQDVADKIELVLTSPELAGKLRAAGSERIKLFPPEKMAGNYLDIYRRIALGE